MSNKLASPFTWWSGPGCLVVWVRKRGPRNIDGIWTMVGFVSLGVERVDSKLLTWSFGVVEIMD
jgi:hypothetical protein